MGGKHKVANRTKNNVRPSSSGRSAEFLGSSISQFTGFSGGKEVGFALPGFSLATNSEELEASLDSNFQLVFKKINKKDSTTKLKGLQEFADLVKNSEPEAVKAVLPFWPRCYNVLATDIDNRVREATHLVHHQIVLKAKRNLAPYLKQIMAPWFTSQYDTYPPAATAASQAFQDAFPPNKIQEAIAFCQEEILTYINDNLLVQTGQTMSNLKTMSAEDAEAKYERVQISCLQGYYLYLNKVSTEHIQKVAKMNNEIVSNSRFWKLAKHKVSPIRAAWFEVLTAILQKAKFLLEEKGAQVCSAVFNNLDEAEPTVLPYVWESALCITSSVDNWWTYVNIDKLLIPKLWKILKQGGHGSASVIYPNLLPLLSHFPPSLSTHSFYNTFFENLRIGLKQKTVIASRSESVAVVTALIECLRYIILKNSADKNLCESLITSHIFTTINWCLIDNQACHKVVFNQITALVQYWNRYSKETGYENYSSFVNLIFDNITTLFKDALSISKDYKPTNISEIACKQIEFLQCLKHIAKPKRQMKVKFAVGELETSVPAEDCSSTLLTDEEYFEKLNTVVYNVCQIYVNFIIEKQAKELMEYLCSLVEDFNSWSFFMNLSKSIKKGDKNSELIDIYDNLLYKWLKSSYLCSKYVVSLIFLLFKHVLDDDKKKILQSMKEITREDCLGWCITEALSHPHNKDRYVQNWLQSDQVSDFLVSIAEKEISDTCTPEWSILFKLALTENENGELYIKKDAVTKIIEKLNVTLQNENEHTVTIDTCSSLAAYISTIIYTETLLLNYTENLLLALFKFSCKSKIDPEIISTETMYEVSTSWQDVITILSKGLSKTEFEELTTKFASVIEETILNNSLEENDLNHLATVVVNYLRASYKSVPLSLNELLNVFLERSFHKPWGKNITNLCKIAEYVRGNLCSPNEEIGCDLEKTEEINVLKYFMWSYLKVAVVSSSITDCSFDDDEEDDEGEETNTDKRKMEDRNPTVLYVVDNNEEFMLQLLYDLSIAQCYLDNYKNTKFYEDILQYHNLLKEKIKVIVQKFDNTLSTKLKNLLINHIITGSWFWCKTAYLLYTDVTWRSPTDIFEEFSGKVKEKNSLGVLHLTQTFSIHLNFDHVQHKFDMLGSCVILRSLVHCEDIDVQIAEVYGKIEELRNELVPQFLYNNPNINWEKTQEIIEIVRLCAVLMEHKYSSLSRRHWDFVVLSLTSWSSNLLKARHLYEKCQVQALVTAVVKLFTCTDNTIKKLKEENISSTFINEWEDLFVESVHTDFVQLWIYLAEQFESKQDTHLLPYLPFLHEYSSFINNVNHAYIFKFNDSSLPKWTKFLKRSCSLLANPLPVLQIWGYKMLHVLVPGLVVIDCEAVDTNTPHRKGLIFEQFKEKLVQTHEIVNSMLLGFKLGEDSCRVKPSTDSFTYTFAYLLLWDVLLTLCEQSSSELRFQYADWLRNQDFLRNFLNNLFRLMPTEILHYSEGKSKAYMDLFLVKPSLNVKDMYNCDKIEWLVCWLYASALAQLPALVRQWWTGLETRVAQIVEKVTAVYVSPNLCNQELTQLADSQQHQTKFKNMVIKVMPSVREVVAIYTVDEAQMELVISLPSNYPLGGPEVQCNRQIGGTTHKQWLLQFKKCVLHQNGRIWDGLSLWNNNLDKKFDGVEECYICFAVLHPGTYQLPKLCCQTCKKKFHSACLYKWFSTSNKSTCPICRNLF